MACAGGRRVKRLERMLNDICNPTHVFVPMLTLESHTAFSGCTVLYRDYSTEAEVAKLAREKNATVLTSTTEPSS